MKTFDEKECPVRHRIRPMLALQVFFAAAVIVPIVLTVAPALAAGKKVDKREIEARQAFAAGQYPKALDLYAELYADTVHPTYLRNIGRCYQNLKQPDKAINAFRDYLRQAKKVTAGERGEVEAYISEMEALKKEQQADLAAAKPPVTQPTVPVVPAAAPTGPQPNVSQQLVARPQQEPVSEPTPFYKKGWFWGVVTVAVIGGVVGGLAAGGAFSSKSSIACTAPGGCY